MPTAIVTGSGGLIGSESVRHFAADGFDVVGIDNDMRAAFFGAERHAPATSASGCRPSARRASSRADLDIRDADGVERDLRRATPRDLELVVHAAAQPSHDWAAREPADRLLASTPPAR